MLVRRVGLGIINAMLLLGMLAMIVPFLYMVSSSFKTQGEIYTWPISLLPQHPIFDNYGSLFTGTQFGRVFFNSAFIALTYTMLALFLTSLAGYGFAKYDFRGKNLLFILVLASVMLPFQVVLIPLFQLMFNLHLINTYQGIIIPFAASAFGIFFMRQFMLTVPGELLDAGRIDGATEFGLYWRIAVPIARPAFGVMGILFFLGAWNDYLWPVIMLRTDEMQTLPVYIASLNGLYAQQYGAIMAASTLATLPMLIVFLALQKQFIAGLSVGAIKG